MKVISIVGARPQFVKAAPVSVALRRCGCHERLVHTGQHYDPLLSDVFFRDLGLPDPDHHLGIGSASHGKQTGMMLSALEAVLTEESPDCVLVYGDTNSTLAGALAAAKLDIPVAHIEAGLRSYQRVMPEEINRILTDHCASLLFCPSARAVENLRREGIGRGVFQVGDPMLDTLRLLMPAAETQSDILQRLDLIPGGYLLATLHRPYNVDDPDMLLTLIDALVALDEPVVLPLHPRTRERWRSLGRGDPPSGLRFVDPLGYLDMLQTSRHARVILTDSGGVQKEALYLGVPCVTLRPETEWPETIESGWNRLAERSVRGVVEAVGKARPMDSVPPPLYGDGHAAEKISTMLRELGARRDAI